jgi:hypothetical protein
MEFRPLEPVLFFSELKGLFTAFHDLCNLCSYVVDVNSAFPFYSAFGLIARGSIITADHQFSISINDDIRIMARED